MFKKGLPHPMPPCPPRPVPTPAPRTRDEKTIDSIIAALSKEHSETIDVAVKSEAMRAEIKTLAKNFTEDNIELPLSSDYLRIETAMLIGALLGMRY